MADPGGRKQSLRDQFSDLTYFGGVEDIIYLPSHVKEILYGFLEKEDYWKRRFSNDVLVYINKGNIPVCINDLGNYCMDCYEYNISSINEFIVDHINDMGVIEDHSNPDVYIDFNQYVSSCGNSRFTLVHNNFTEFKNWLAHWNGPYSLLMTELMASTNKIQCCSNVYPCGGKAYYEGWICDNITIYETNVYMTHAGLDNTGGERIITDNGRMVNVVQTLDFNRTGFISREDCLYVSDREIKTKKEINDIYSYHKDLFSPIHWIFNDFERDESINEFSIKAEDIMYHDMCVLHIKFLGRSLVRTDPVIKVTSEVLFLSGYFTGHLINLERGGNTEVFINEFKKNYKLKIWVQRSLSNYINKYLVE